MKAIANISRIILGLTFIFSGFVKSVDPYGTAYKMAEYLNVFGLSSLANTFEWIPITASVILCSFEFVLGILLISFIFRRTINWIMIAVMSFFTVLTLFDAVTNKVADCGCFGDAIILTNWQTFWKNIALDIFLVLAIVFDRSKTHNKLERLYANTYTVLISVFVFVFAVYNAVYEPILDFRPWKEGNRMVPALEDQKPSQSFVTYQNIETKEEVELDMDELMQAFETNPSFAEEWEFIDSRTVEFNEVNAEGFTMLSYESLQDEALNVLSTKDTFYLLTVQVLDKIPKRSIDVIKNLYNKTSPKGVPIYMLTASAQSAWEGWKEKNELEDIVMYSADEQSIQTIMRSSPGIVMMADGVVIKKWSWRVFPKQN